jgi:hypothetical protein
MTRTHIVVAVAAVAATSAFAGEAHAQAVTATVAAPAVVVESEGTAANRAGASVAGDVGFLVGSGGATTFAIGAKGGYTFPFHLYIGGDFSAYIAGATLITVSPRVGYDIGLPVNGLVIRPYAGIGFAYITVGGLGGYAGGEFYPGAEVLYYITRGFFVGGDARVPIFFGSGGAIAGFNLYATVGYKF